MRVALITEGTYPVHAGGVSAWCDQLIRGLPEVAFEVVALSGSGRERVTFDLPENVVAVHRLGLWAPPRRARRTPRATRERFAAAYEQFLDAVLGDDSFAPARFEASLRTLAEPARSGHLTALLRSQAGVDLFLNVWSRGAPAIRRSADHPLSLADVLAVTDLVDHYLRPLQLPALDVDVVHAAANGPCAMVGLATKWERDTPVVVSEHGVYLRERILATRAAAGTPALRAILIRFFARLTELGYRAADAILPVSGFNSRWAVRNGAAPSTVRVVHNGVDPAAFPPAAGEPDDPTLVYVGRIDPLKDLETMIRAFALVRERVPGARLRLFGPVPAGNEGYARVCEKLTADLGLADAVTFEGPIAPVRRAYEAGHVVVLSSVSEGLPMTIIEAQMSGRATVATDVGGMAEAAGGGGLIVPTRDPRAFADACTSLLLDDAKRARLAEAGRRRALRMFTIDRFVGDFRALYAGLAGVDDEVAVPAPRAPRPAVAEAR